MYHYINKFKNGKIVDKVSTYKPSKEVSDVIKMVQKDMAAGRQVLTNSYVEFNYRSVLQEQDDNQKRFNSFVSSRSDDADESWRANTVRPVTRNKLISIAAHVTAQILYPNAFAQNNRDEEDRGAAMIMRDSIEWVIDNSNYSYKFLQAVVAALTDPVTIVEAEFAEVMRKIKEKNDKGELKVKEVVDEIFSGFQFYLIQCNEFYIANAYEPNLQKQRFVAKRKYKDYEEMRLKWGEHENWQYVSSGVRHVFDIETSTFFSQVDETMKGYLVEEVTYFNHGLDLQLTFLNGVLMCDKDYPLQRIDKKYPFAKMGYEFLRNGEFFYYKSAANKLGSDQDLIDTMYNMVMDGTFLALMPPMALYGSEDIDSTVMVPGSITSFKDPNTKLESIGPRSDLRAGLEAIGMIEKSMSESSQDNTRQGINEGGTQTAYQFAQLQKNAAIALGMFSKMVGFFVEDLGQLICSDIVQHLSVGEISEITSSSGRMAFKSFILPDKIENGKKVTKKIQFTDEDYDKESMTQEEIMSKSFKIMDEEGGFDSKVKIYKVNPKAFRELKFKVKVKSDFLEVPNKNLEKALNLEAYDRLIQNPTLDQDAVTQDFLVEVYRPGEGDKYKKKIVPVVAPTEGGGGNERDMTKQKGVNQNMVGQMTGGGSLKSLLEQG